MASAAHLRPFIDALEEPSLVVSGLRVMLANAAANELFGRAIEGLDVRLAIRNPIALELIVAGQAADAEIAGIGRPGQPWLLSIRVTGDDLLLVRLTDRSATRAAERMRVDFVANASHELRTPLATILGYAETIADGDLQPDETTRFGGIIQSEARRMLRIVEDLMSLSRIEADRFVAPREEVALGDIVALSLDHVRQLASERDCSVEVELQPDLPAIQGDRGQLVQLLDNLISNALRYGCSGPGSVVRVTVACRGARALLTVSDQGEGIPREHLPRLTERFYRVDEARSRNSGGTGLGLAIVKHIVERHRGSLEIRSEPGRGTEVRIALPLP